MDKLPSLFDGGHPLLGSNSGERTVVRSKRRKDPFEIEAQMIDGALYVPLECPVYVDDIVERDDPRGGVVEYQVNDVKQHVDPFGHGGDYAEVLVREKGHASRAFGEVNVTIHGGSNQFAVGDSNHLQQATGAGDSELIAALNEILQNAPRSALSEAELEELTEAVVAAATTSTAPGAKPSATKRSLLAVRGIIQDVSDSAQAGANDGVKSWAKQAVLTLAGQISGL
jgi:hypothetical protein